MSIHINTVVADDHPLIVEALRKLIGNIEGIRLIATCEDGHDLVQTVAVMHPQLIIMDLAMPTLSGDIAAHEILRRFPETKIIVCTGLVDEQRLNDMVMLGVKAIVTKEDVAEELPDAIRAVLNGREYYSPFVTRSMIESKYFQPMTGNQPQLSQREEEVLSLILAGLPRRRICAELSIAHSTYSSHRKSIMRKLGVHSSHELVYRVMLAR